MAALSLNHKNDIDSMDRSIRFKYMQACPGMFYLPNSTLLVKFSPKTSKVALNRAISVVEGDPSILHVMHIGKDRYGKQLEHKATANYCKALDMARDIIGGKDNINLRYVNGRNVIAMVDAIREGVSYKNAKGGTITELRQMDDLECRLVKKLSKLGLPIPSIYKPCIEENKPSLPAKRYMEVGFDESTK